ncbi:heptose-I-phosphate ethanolaminephosphotransferase [Methylobacillus rhizosphaerae]|uniref:Heptose-I-phosphate ethanolaminephosphotransferase n=1 Tax=Methylobacillus rhizosphaerae TaxID=551994 RepID=A0A239AF23_9PROT|nr:heptose-I-phosphate ethanolaminephosphotransferase [Methylobacillus rhizosphaerae]
MSDSSSMLTHKFIDRVALKSMFNLYLFFFYFSGVTHVLLQLTDATVFIGLRQAIYMSLIWIIPVLIFPERTRIITATIGIVLWISSLLSLAYFCVYHQEISQSVLYIIFESNVAESSEYISQYFKWWMPIIYITHTLMAYILWRRIQPVQLKMGTRFTASLLIIAFVFLVPFIKDRCINHLPWDGVLDNLQRRMEPAEPWQLIMGYFQYQRQLGNMEALLDKNRSLPPLQDFHDDFANQPGTLVLVIGESSTRMHWGLYGYPRNTTPNLDKLKNKLHIFTHVVSPRASTIEALEQVLTFADRDHPDAVMTQPSLMNMMKQAGYKTFWITNQQTITKRNTMLAYFSQLADVQHYTNNSRYQNSREYDSNVFAPFDQALADPAQRKFIVVHLLGTHMKYEYRYPPEFDFFQDQSGLPSWLDQEQIDIVNTYDNAVRYNDFVLATLIKKLDAQQQRSMLTFLSDHGEEVYDTPPHDFLGRNEGKPTLPMFAIPMFIWTSPLWQQNSHIDFSSTLDRVYSSAYFEHTWSDLAGLNYLGFDASKSLVNKQFTQRPTWIGDPSFRKGMRQISQ